MSPLSASTPNTPANKGIADLFRKFSQQQHTLSEVNCSLNEGANSAPLLMQNTAK